MERRERWGVTAVLAAVAVMTAADVAADWGSGTTSRHVMVEVGIIVAMLAALAGLWSRSVLGLRARLHQSDRDLQRLRADAEDWRRRASRYLAGLSRAMDEQFRVWALSDSEKEVALLLLKGLSLKEIARVRGVSERTARHQTQAVYRKAGLAGRAELSAFFLEDLMLPVPEAEHGDAPPPAGGAGASPPRPG